MTAARRRPRAPRRRFSSRPMAGRWNFSRRAPAARAYFFDARGEPKAVGAIVRNPQFAATLRAIAARGADAFYGGDIARDIVAAVRGHANPGTLSLDDLSSYRVRDVEAPCGV